jgi:cysteine synthase A
MLRGFSRIVAPVAATVAAAVTMKNASCKTDDKKGVYPTFEGIRPTPLVELATLSKALGCRVLVKCEHLHPTGSVKERAATYLVAAAEKSGELQPGGTVFMPTGGNTGISLAMICKAKGYKCHVTIPMNISPDKIELLQLLGAEVTICPCVPFTDPKHYVNTAKRLYDEGRLRGATSVALPDQFEHTANQQAHFDTTGPEIWAQAGGRVDAFVCAAGTGGTIAGLSSFLKGASQGRVSCHIVDPPGSGLKCAVEVGLFEGAGACFIDGIGITRETANFAMARPHLDGAFRSTDREAIEMAYYLLRNEGLWVGPSAALNVCGAVHLARKLQLTPDQTVVTILCDSGERYKNTTFNVAWQKEKGLEPLATGTALDFIAPHPPTSSVMTSKL